MSVSPSAALMRLPHEIRIPVQANHTDIVKFSSRSDLTYISVRTHLKSCLEFIPQTKSLSANNMAPEVEIGIGSISLGSTPANEGSSSQQSYNDSATHIQVPQQTRAKSPSIASIASRLASALSKTPQMTTYDESGSLPSGWETGIDPKTKHRYYVDHANQTTTWIRPSSSAEATSSHDSTGHLGPLPDGWEARSDNQGRIYFVNRKFATIGSSIFEIMV
jgi:hypothetical protein